MSYAHTLTADSCDTDTLSSCLRESWKIETCFYFYPLYILKGLLHQTLGG